MERWSIYGLYDPKRPNEIRVIGKTKQRLRVRLCGHIAAARRKRRLGRRLWPSQVWILKLIDRGTEPSIRLIEKCHKAIWKRRERRAIALYRNRGHGLLNVHPGGDGCDSREPKVRCDRCGARRKRFPNGDWYCPNCRNAGRRRTDRETRKTPGYKAYQRHYERAHRNPHRKAYHRAYSSDRYRAKKLGLTVKEFRARQVDHD